LKKAKPESPIEIVIIIRPNCLKVDKAMIFFKSNSKFVPRPAINIANLETNNKIVFSQHLKEGLERINKKAPAVTKVNLYRYVYVLHPIQFSILFLTSPCDTTEQDTIHSVSHNTLVWFHIIQGYS
jgi:hypothetical protein